MPCGATQDGWVMVERSDRMWSTGEGKGKPLQYFCLRTPWTVWKGKMIGYWKRNSPLVKAMVFPVVMYGCESWTVKKAERRKINAFELWCWRRLLRIPWTARRSNQSILREISPGCSLEGLMLKLKLQYFGHLIWRVDSLEKTLMLGGTGGRRRRGQQRMRWLDGITNLMDVSLSELRELDGQGGLVCCDSWGRKESDTTEWLNWIEVGVVIVMKKGFKPLPLLHLWN